MAIELEVKAVLWHSRDLFELVTARGALEFRPGDHLGFDLGEHGGLRHYSIASGTGERLLRFLIRRLPHSAPTAYLATLKPGARLPATGPQGDFHPAQDCGDAPFAFFAIGTGIAPFLSYCKSFRQRPPAYCCWGVRFGREAVGADFLRKACPVHLATSQERHLIYHHGRITDFLPQLRHPAEMHYYLCGLDAMIRDVSAWLARGGCTPEHVHTESYARPRATPA